MGVAALGPLEKVPELIQDWIRLAEEELAKPVADKHELAKRIVTRIVDEYSGEQFYLPGNWHKRAALARAVFAEFDGGNFSELKRKYKRSKPTIYRLIHLGRRLEMADRQGDLFDASRVPGLPQVR